MVGGLADFSRSPVLNKIKGWFSSGKQESEPKNFYPGGTGYGYGHYHGGSQASGGKWPYSLSSPGSGLFLNHFSLRQGARVAMQESPQGRAIIDRKVDAIANTGLKLEPTPDAKILGISQEQAAEWGRDVGNRFHLFAKSKKQHRSETLSFYQFQWLYTYFKERDNDIFVRLYYSPDKNLQNPLQFEFIDPDQIRGHGYTVSYGFQQHKDGIIRDDRGRETGYKVWVRKKDGTFKSVEVKKRGPKSGRIFMLHGFRQEYAGQGRGFTKLAPIIQDLENFTDFSFAHIKQAINQAQIVGWVKPSDEEDAIPIFDENLTAAGAGPAAKNFSSEGNDEEGTPVPATIPLANFACYDLPEASFSTPGSTFIQSLTKGADITLAKTNAPSTGYDKFTDTFLTSLSACSGTPLEVVHMKFAQNFSASRATLLLFQRICEIERADMETDALDPIYEMWLSGEIGAGRIVAPGWSDPRLKAAWLKSTWRGTPVPDIDPGKLAKARKDNLETGATNIEYESQNYNGMSAIDNISINNRSYQEYQPLPFSKSAGGAGMNSDSSQVVTAILDGIENLLEDK
jgi:capsid protein